MSGVEFIRQKCKEKGISVRKLEQDLGFSNGYLNPKRLHVIPYQKALKIADYLNIGVERILEMPNESYTHVDPQIAEIARRIYEDDNLMILFNRLEKANEQDLQFVVDLARRLTTDD